MIRIFGSFSTATFFVTWTLQSTSICLIRSHYLEYAKYFNLDAEKYNMRGISVCCFPSVCCIFKLLLTSHHKYRGTLQGILQGTLLQDDLPVSTTARRVQLPVTWALCRIDQVSTSPALITPYTFSLHLLPTPSPLLSFGSMFLPHTRHFQASFFLLLQKWSYQTLWCHLWNSKHRDRSSRRVIVSGYEPRALIYVSTSTTQRRPAEFVKRFR